MCKWTIPKLTLFQTNDLNQAWDLYYQVFRRINKLLPQLKVLELEYMSPNLLAARNLELAVPGLLHLLFEINVSLTTLIKERTVLENLLLRSALSRQVFM